jgi:hypothetical protein
MLTINGKSESEKEGAKTEIGPEEFVKEVFSLAKEKLKKRQRQEPSEMVKEVVEMRSNGQEIPQEIKNMVQMDYDRLSKKITGEDLREEIKISTERIIASYYNMELNIPNGSLANVHLMTKIEDVMIGKDGGEPTVEDLKKIARLSIDLNALKPANDLNGGNHLKGDEYLELCKDEIGEVMKEVFDGQRDWAEVEKEIDSLIADESLREMFKAEKKEYYRGLEIMREQVAYLGLNKDFFLSRDGGDEFGLIITSGKGMSQDFLDNFSDLIKKKVWTSPKAGEIIDFNDKEVVLRFLGVDKATFATMGGDLAKLKEAYKIPGNFRFRAGASVGGATLHRALLDPKNREERKLHREDSGTRFLKVCMGDVKGTSDREMDGDKIEIKGSYLDKPEGSVEFLMAQIYSRNQRERELTVKNKELQEEAKILRAETEKLRTALGNRQCPHCGKEI